MNAELWLAAQQTREVLKILSDEYTWDLIAEAVWWVDYAIQNPELVALGLVLLMGMAFTAKQRKWIRDRDNNQSQMRHYSEEEGWHTSPERPGDTLQVHHIKPQAAGGKDEPYNAITVWEREHTGKNARPGEFVIHPDMGQALQEYRNGDKDAFKKAAKEHRTKAARGEVFWERDHDVELGQTAKENTDRETMRGNLFPKKKGKR